MWHWKRRSFRRKIERHFKKELKNAKDHLAGTQQTHAKALEEKDIYISVLEARCRTARRDGKTRVGIVRSTMYEEHLQS